MLYYLHQYVLDSVAGTTWEEPLSGLRVFRYISVRSIGAAFTSLILSWVLAPIVIDWLKALKFRQNYVDKAEAAGGMVRVIDKTGTPTMGGVLIVLSLDLSALIWAQWNSFVLLTLLSLIVLSALGFYDDYLKVTKQNNEGAKSNVKLWVQLILGFSVAGYLWMVPETRGLVSDLMVPFIKYPILENVAWIGITITVLAIVGSSNAVNLTDGLDGLAIGCTIIVTIVFMLVTYVSGNIKFASYLQIPYTPGVGELTVFCAAMLGASVGFLWYN
ncbi:MAG: phospho-N-acetylmuramoyl-pentapeptide-transferase, partial [Verrucomicrobia bacterium]|nr:phospho-N-acetylmuramoyl-pentapeptide-transferase [Verrucomicrobiota bacterium]